MKFFFLFIAIVLQGCSSAMLSVRSVPEGAQVLIVSEGRQPVNIGKTPLTSDQQKLLAQGGKSVQLQIQKEGYYSESFLIPKNIFSSNIQISSVLREHKTPNSCTQQTFVIGDIVKKVARAQQLTQTQKYDQALQLLNNLVIENDGLSVVYDLLGNVYYLSGQLQQALDAYEKSLQIDNNSAETQRMVTKLRSIVSGRSPASEGGL